MRGRLPAAVDALAFDLRLAARSLRRAPGFTAIVVLTLALGLGALVAVFGALDQVALRALPYGEPDDLVALHWERADGREVGSPFGHFHDLERTVTTLEMAWAIFPYLAEEVVLDTDEGSVRVDGTWVSADYFDVLGVEALRGRTFAAGENDPGTARVAVLSHATWQSRFGGAADVVGTDVRINGAPHRIVGVLPAAFESLHHGGAGEIWLPFALEPELVDTRVSWGLDVIGRLRPGVALEQASAELGAAGAELSRRFPADWSEMTLQLRSLHERQLGRVGDALTLLLAAAAFVLLVACANLAHLLLARLGGRQREIAVRRALGAGRLQVARLIVCESLLLGLMGGGIGLLTAVWGVELMLAAVPGGLSRTMTVGLDARLATFALLTSLAAGLLFGVIPGLRAAPRTASLRVASSTGTATEQRFRDLLVAAESALVLTLLIAATLSLASLRNLLAVDPGFEPAHRYTTTLTRPERIDPSSSDVMDTFDRIEESLASLPGVRAAGTISHLPLARDSWGGRLFIEGQAQPVEQPAPAASTPLVDWEVTSPGYFAAAGVDVVEGRGFTDGDDRASPGVTVVNETLARLFFPSGDAIGKRINGNSPDGPWRTIVGIVRDVKQQGLGDETRPYMYVHASQVFGWPQRELVVWGEAPPEALLPEVRRAVRAAAPQIAVDEIRPMGALVDASVSGPRFQALLLGLLGGIAVSLGIVGIYGVVSHAVSRRTRELGVRLALGAEPRRLVARSTWLGVRPVALGMIAGVAGGVAAGRVMGALLFAVQPADPGLLIGTCALLAVVAMTAAWLPSRRAGRVDPMSSLRAE